MSDEESKVKKSLNDGECKVVESFDEQETKKENVKVLVVLKEGFTTVQKVLCSSIAHMIDIIKQDLLESKKETKQQGEGDNMVGLEEPFEKINVDVLNEFSSADNDKAIDKEEKNKTLKNKLVGMRKKESNKEFVASGPMFYFGINILFYLIVIYIIALGANKAYDFSYQVFGDVAMEEEPGRKVEFTIGTGESKLQVAQSLLDKKLIKSKYAFLIRLNMGQKEIVPNEYKLSTAMNYGEIIEKICNDEKGKDKT